MPASIKGYVYRLMATLPVSYNGYGHVNKTNDVTGQRNGFRDRWTIRISLARFIAVSSEPCADLRQNSIYFLTIPEI